MSLRFRKRIKLSDGLYINLSKNGISSVSIGKPGMTMNIGGKTSSMTVGVPGTGISYRKQFSKSTTKREKDSTDYQALADDAEKYLSELLKKRREELDQLLSLNAKISVSSHQKYWDDLDLAMQERYDGVKAFDPFISNFPNLIALTRAIKHNQDGFIFLENSSVVLPWPIPIPSLIIYPISIFGKIYAGSGMGVADKEYPFIIDLNLNSLSVSTKDKESGKNNYIGLVLSMLVIPIASYLAIFYWHGFLVTTGGILGAFLSFYIAKRWFPVIFAKNPINNFAIAHAISQKSKVWAKELSDEKKSYKDMLNNFRQSALSGNNEDIIASLPLVTFGLEGQSDVQIQAGIDDVGSLCLLLQLPPKTSIEVKNKLTPGGKESVQEKSEKELNTEYATAVLNLSFYILCRCYSAYPTINQIKLAGCVQRVNDSTGNDDIEAIVFFDSKREDLNEIKFDKVNIIKTVQHLKYSVDMDDKNHMNTLKVFDSNISEMKNDIIPVKRSA